MADDYTLTTNEDGQAVYRDSEGRTLSPSEYFGAYVASRDGGGGITSLTNTSTASGGGATTTAGAPTLAQVEALVDKTYLDETGRASTFNDPGGRAYWIGEIMSGRVPPDKLDDYFNASDEGIKFDARGTTTVTTTDGGTTKVTGGTTKVTTTGALTREQAETLVDRTYLDETGRASTFNDPGGRAFYVEELMSGRIPPDQLARELSKSTEGRNFDLNNLSKGLLTIGYVDPLLTAKLTRIKDLYKTKLGRDPDEAGLRSYLAQEDENYDFNQAITKSPEALVRDAFKRVHNREPSASDQAYYMDELKKGRTYDQIVSDLRRSDEYQTKVSPVRGPGDVLYSNPATAAQAGKDFAGFPLVSKAVTGADGKVTNKLELNLPQQKDFSLGVKADEFKDYTPTVFAENPYVSNIFGGASKADADRTGVGGQRVFSSPASATQDYSKLGIGTAGGITSLADVTKAANAAPFTLGNTMANNLGTNLGTTAGVNLDLTSNAGTIGMAQGGMIMSDPVMRRAMFRNGGPVSSKGYGITSNVTTPDENAMAMQTMFQPPGFRDGGPVQYFQQGGEAEAVLPPSRQIRTVDGEPGAPRDRLSGGFEVFMADPTILPRMISRMLIGDKDGEEAIRQEAQQRARDTRRAPIDDEQEFTGRNMKEMAARARRGADSATVPVEAAPPTPLEALRAQVRNPEPRYRSVMDVVRQNREEGRMLPIDDEQAYTGQSMRILEEDANPRPPRSMGSIVRDSTRGIGEFFDRRAQEARTTRMQKPRPPREVDVLTERKQTEDLQRQANAQMRQAIDDRDDINRQGRATVSERIPPPDDTGRRIAERVPATTSLEKLKADREANKAQRRENQLLALMQAGFAMAAGRSPNALANLAAGGASGVATLAGLEKERRADDALLRREILETELAQERTREARAERQAGREQTAAQRQQSLLQNVSVNTRQEVSSINTTIANEEAKLLNPAVTEEQKAPIKAEIQRLKNQRDAAVEQMYSVYESLGIKRPKTPEQQQAGEFKFLGAKK